MTHTATPGSEEEPFPVTHTAKPSSEWEPWDQSFSTDSGVN